MRTSLALGLLACVLCVVAALVLVRASDVEVPLEERSADASLPITPVASHAVTTEPRSDVADRTPVRVDDLPAQGDAPPIGTITVHVVQDEDGTPIEGAQVQVVIATGLEVRTVERATDPTGLVSFAVPPAEARLLTAQAAGRDRLVHAFGTGAVTDLFDGGPESEVQPVDRMEIELRLVAERSVLVRLVDGAGNALREDSPGMTARIAQCLSVVVSESCAVYAAAAPQAASLGSLEPSLPGPEFLYFPSGEHQTSESRAPIGASFECSLTTRGKGSLCAHALLGYRVLATQRIGPGQDSVELRISRTALEGLARALVLRVVKDADGEPIPGARVAYTDWGNRKARTTDVEGRIRFERFYELDSHMTVSHEGYETRDCSIERGSQDEVELRLRLGRIVEGLALDVTGKSLTRGRVELHAVSDAGSQRSSEALRVVDTNREGRFRFADVSPGTYLVEISSYDADIVREGESSVPVDCRSGTVWGVIVRQPPPSIPRPGKSWTEFVDPQSRDLR